MLKPFTTFSRLAVLALVGAFALPARGQTYTPVALTGYNHDVIAEGTGAVPSLTTYDVDGSNGAGYAFMSANYVNPSNVANGAANKIPNNGLITSVAAGTTGLTYQLAGYAGNNVLRVPATGNTGGGTGTGADAGTVSFATPAAASTVYVLATGGGGAITNGMTVTITFSDNSTQTFTGQTLPDWFTPNGATVAYQGFGRVARTAASGIDNASATTPNLYQLAYNILPANVTKPIASITFGKTVTATGVIDVFAVSTATVPVCTAAPSTLSAAATTTSGGSTALTAACPSTSIYLSVTGVPANTAGYAYQWQASTTSATAGFADITGATGPTYTATNQTATTYYRVVVRCLYDGASGAAVPSSAVQVTQNPATNCYCVPSAHTSTGTLYTSVTTVTLPGDGGATLTNAPGLLASPYYAQYPASTTTTSLSVNGSYTLTVAAIANQRVSAWIDFNQDGAFDASEFYILRNASGAVYGTAAGNLTATIVPPFNTLTGATRLRIRSDYFSNTVLNTGTNACATTQYGQTMDYTLSVAATACAGAPAAPTASASATTACAGTAIVLSAMLPAGVTGLTLQWQSRPAGSGTFANITGATTNPYTVASQTAGTDYRLLLTCAAGGATPSNVVTVAQSPFLNCYCTPTYSSGGANDMIARVRLDVLDNATTGNATPYYRDYASAQTGSAATLQVPTLYAGTPAALTLNFGSDGNQYNGVWVDFNQNGVFETSEYFTSGTNAGANGQAVVTITIPATAAVVAGQTKMRIRGGDDSQPNSGQACGASSSSYGEAEDYLVNIVATPCTGIPPALTAAASAASVCGGTSFTLSATGLAAGTTGVTYQWQSSPAGANTFANIGTVQTSPTYTVSSQMAATDYRVVATCGSGSPTTSSVVSVTQSAFLTCYCAPVSTGTNEHVKSVTLPGTPGFTNATGANSTGGYGDFTADPARTTTLVAGTTYTGATGVSVTVRSNASNSQGGLWIDYDHSGTFEASEYTLLGTSSLQATDVTFSGVTLAVPATALAGPTRARVRWRNSAFTGADACTGGTTGWYGETEDYLVSICQPSTAGFSYGSGPYCVSGTTNPAVTLATGATAGTFSSTTGLTINATTGAITLASSTPGTYIVTNTVSGSCNAAGTTTITINAAPTAGFSYSAGSYCVSGTSNPTAALTGGATAGTFSSTAGLTLDATTGAITLSSSTPGTYTVTNTVAASGGCAAVTSTATVTINAAPTAAFSYPATAVCAGTAATLSPTLATGATAGTFTLPTVSGLTINATTGAVTVGATAAAGTYTVTNTVAASGGCAAATSTTSFTVTPATTATFSYPAGPYCVSGSTGPVATVTGTAGGTFSAPTGLTINATTGAITLASSTPGTYTVTYAVPTTSTQCGSTATASVTITAAPTAAFSYGTATTFCISGTTNPTATLGTGATAGTFSSTAGLTLNASTGAITLSSSTAGTYTVTNTVAASGGCAAVTSTATVTITNASTAAFGFPTATTCAGSATTLTPTLGTGAIAGTFTLPTVSGLTINAATGAVTVGATATAGTYTVTNTVAASGGCAAATSTATFTLTAPTTAAFSYPSPAYCLSGIVPPTPTVTGTAGGTFSASPAGLALNPGTGVISLGSSTAGTYTVTYTVSGACGSSATQTVSIGAPAVATFSYGTASTFCVSGTAAPAVVLGTGATAGTFSSTAGLTLNATTGAITLSSSTPGTYTVTNTVAASGGCAATTATTTVTITAAPLATFSYPVTIFCAGGNTVTPTPVLTAGAVAGTFSSTTGLSINATTGVVNPGASTPGTYVVTNTVAASGGCAAATATSGITISPRPATLTISAAYNGSTTTLTANGATGTFSNYQWYLGPNPVPGAVGPTLVLTGLPAQLGSYTVTITDANGCTSLPSNPLVVTSAKAGIAGSSLRVYPNPTPTGALTLELTGYRLATELTVLDALGRVVVSERLPAGTATHSLNLTGVATGVYLLRLSNADGVETRRLLRE